MTIKLIEAKTIDRNDIQATIEQKKNAWDYIISNYLELMKSKTKIDNGMKQLGLGYLNISSINKEISLMSVERSLIDCSNEIAIPVYLYLLEYKHLATDFLHTYMGPWSNNYSYAYKFSNKKSYGSNEKLRSKVLEIITEDKDYLLKNWNNMSFNHSFQFNDAEKKYLYEKLYDYYISKISTGIKVLTVIVDLFRDKCKKEHIDLYCQRLLNRKDIFRAKQLVKGKIIDLTDDQKSKLDSILMFEKMR